VTVDGQVVRLCPDDGSVGGGIEKHDGVGRTVRDIQEANRTEPSPIPTMYFLRTDCDSPLLGLSRSMGRSSGFVQMTARSAAASRSTMVLDVPSVISRKRIAVVPGNTVSFPTGAR
jgi:hypothetical protein